MKTTGGGKKNWKKKITADQIIWVIHSDAHSRGPFSKTNLIQPAPPRLPPLLPGSIIASDMPKLSPSEIVHKGLCF